MSEATLKAHIVRVKFEDGKIGQFYATSEDLRGLLVAEPTLEALERAVPQAIAEMYAARGVDVVVTMAEESEADLHVWVAFPTEVARQALERRAS